MTKKIIIFLIVLFVGQVFVYGLSILIKRDRAVINVHIDDGEGKYSMQFTNDEHLQRFLLDENEPEFFKKVQYGIKEILKQDSTLSRSDIVRDIVINEPVITISTRSASAVVDEGTKP